MNQPMRDALLSQIDLFLASLPARADEVSVGYPATQDHDSCYSWFTVAMHPTSELRQLLLTEMLNPGNNFELRAEDGARCELLEVTTFEIDPMDDSKLLLTNDRRMLEISILAEGQLDVYAMLDRKGDKVFEHADQYDGDENFLYLQLENEVIAASMENS